MEEDGGFLLFVGWILIICYVILNIYRIVIMVLVGIIIEDFVEGVECGVIFY